jgi:ribonuclease HI
VVEKRLRDITAADFTGHEQFSSPEEMLKTYQSYYGPQVSLETPIKMIHFTLHKKRHHATNIVDSDTTRSAEAKLYADGGSRGNPGPSASGYVILTMNDEVVVKKGIYLGVTTNNQAEYQALKLGLEDALGRGIQKLHVYMDSLLVVNQMLGIFKVKNRDLWPIHDAIKQLVTKFKHITFTQVPRELNKLADGQVNEALDTEAGSQSARG